MGGAYQDYLAMLDVDPNDRGALASLESACAATGQDPELTAALDQARRRHRDRGSLTLVSRLYDVELGVASSDRKGQLLYEKGCMYMDELLQEQTAIECLEQVVADDPQHSAADELTRMSQVREHWKKITERFVEEAENATDRSLSTALYTAAAEHYQRYEPGSAEVERYLRKALEIDPHQSRASAHLERKLRDEERWKEVRALLEERIDAAAKPEERLAALLKLADLARTRLELPDLALEAMKKVIAADPGHPKALGMLADHYEAEENWSALVMLYEGALKSRRRSSNPETETGMLIQIGMLHWRRLGNIQAAEEYFSRLRKIDPAHQAPLDFYREFYSGQGSSKLVQVYRQALKATQNEERKRQLMRELAELSEESLDNPEKAIDSWKTIMRAEPENTEAREALKRLYLRTEKWNALLDLIKDEVDKLPADDVAGRVAGLMSVVEIYRDRLKLDVMVINTYNSILALDATNRDALAALAQKYEELGRWNDLISVLMRRAKIEDADENERVENLRRVAGLWIDRFGNYAQAIGPLEELLELRPDDDTAIERLKEIYTRRRQWRALIALLGRESESKPVSDRRRLLADMAQLAAERLGDTRLAIDIWNRVLELPGSEADPDQCAPDTPLVFQSLAALYERDKRYAALAEMLGRQRKLAVTPEAAIPILERLGNLWLDRLQGRAQAAEAFRELLRLKPDHGRAARTLREIYVETRDFAGLEDLFGELGQWNELVETLFNAAEKLEDTGERVRVLERAGEIAAENFQNPERVARVYERLQSVDPKHLGSARALVPIYEQIGKWARLLATYEVLLEAAEPGERMGLLAEIRDLCEHRLGSKAQAFQWTARAYRLEPGPELLGELERLGAEADAWEEVSEILRERAEADDIGEEEKLRLLRELARIASVRLHEPERAQEYQRKVLELRPADAEALAALEELASQKAEWPQLLEIYRRRVDLESDSANKLDLLFKIAFIEEERLADSESARKTYRRILEIDGGSRRALKALAKLTEAASDWASLADVLESEIALETDPDAKAVVLLRVGNLYENLLERPRDALDRYKAALDVGPSTQVYAALEAFLDESKADEDTRVEVANLLLSHYEGSDDAPKLARALEILGGAAGADERADIDRRLADLYANRLDDAEGAFRARARLLAHDPLVVDNRERLLELAERTGKREETAQAFEGAVQIARERDASEAALVQLLFELANLCEDLGPGARAESVWKQINEIDAAHASAFAALEARMRTQDRHDELVGLHDRRVQASLDARERIVSSYAIAEISEGPLGDASRAVEAYEQVVELDPAEGRAYDALERLYDAAGDWTRLEETLARRSDYAEDERALCVLLGRRAQLRVRELSDPSGAVELAEDLLRRAPQDTMARSVLENVAGQGGDLAVRSARLLEVVYQEERSWANVVRMLRIQSEAADSDAELGELLTKIATLEDEWLTDEASALKTWGEVLRVLPSDQRAREEATRLGERLGAHAELVQLFERTIDALDDDPASRAALLAYNARVLDEQLGDSGGATRAYARLIEEDPSNPESVRLAATALDRLHGAAERWPEQIEAIRHRAEWADSPEERRALQGRIAGLYEEQLADAESATTMWREIVSENPEDLSAIDALERLYVASDQHRELADLLRRRVELYADPADRKRELVRLAALYETELGELHEAITVHLEVLDELPDDVETYEALARLYRATERYDDLLEILERRAGFEAGAVRLDFLQQAAEVLSSELSRPSEALEHYAEIIAEDSGRAAVLHNIERLFEEPELRPRAAEILEPYYERTSRNPELARLLERLAEDDSDPRSAIGRLRRAVALYEGPLADPETAYACAVRATKLALAEDELPELLGEIQRLAAEQNRLADLIDTYAEIAPDVLDGELQRRLYLDIADLSRAVLQDDDKAVEYYQRVLDAQPDDNRAVIALEGLYRDANEHAKLYDVLIRKSELAGEDLDRRAGALAEAAALCGGPLDRSDDAVMHWEQVLELTPDRKDAFDALERLYGGADRQHDLADLLERRLGYAFTVEEAVALRFRLGHLYEEQLGDPDSAVENYSAALGGDPEHAGATTALERLLDDPVTRTSAAEVLEPIYVSQQDWPKLVRIYEIKLEAADDQSERLQLTRYIARLYEDQLEDLDGAFRWYGRVFRESPSDMSIRGQLVRLANVLQNWSDLAVVYQEYLDDESSDAPEVTSIAEALADIYDKRTGEVERAHAAFRRVLQSDPDNIQVFTRLESMLSRAERWYQLVEAYEEVVHASLDDARRQQIYMRLAAVQEQRLDDPPKAIDALRAALEINPDNRAALEELDRVLQEQKNWQELAEFLLAQIDRSQSDDELVELRMRLAQLREKRLEDPEGAIDQYEEVLGLQGGDIALPALERLVVSDRHRERISHILEPIYRQNDWWQKLVVILDAQLEFVDDPVRRVEMLREVAQIHAERGGDLRLALVALGKAWLEDVADEGVWQSYLELGHQLGSWDAMVATFDKGLENQLDYDIVTRVLLEASSIHETHRNDPEAAIAALRRLLEVAPGEPEALAALDRLLDAQGQHAELVEVVLERAERADDPSIRLVFMKRAARIYQDRLDDTDKAIETWRNVYMADDADGEALEALEALYRATENHRERVQILERQIEVAEESAHVQALHFAAAAVYERDLEDRFEALSHLRAITQEDPDNAEALAGLDRLLVAEQNWADLLEILDRRVAIAGTPEQRAELAHRAATLVARELMEPDRAIERLSAIVDEVPTHSPSRESLEELLKSPETMRPASAVLERLFRAESAWDELVRIYETRLEDRDADPVQRGQELAVVADIHESQRGDLEAAFQAWARALAENPEDEGVQGQLERIAADRGSWEELASLFEERLAATMDSELELHYANKLAGLYEEALGDLERAAEKYRRALAVASDEAAALASLARIYERASRFEELAEILARQAEVAFDEAEQADFLFRLGDTREQRLEDVAGAIEAYRDVVERDSVHSAARAALERILSSSDDLKADVIAILEPLYEGEGDMARLTDLMGTRLSITEDPFDRAQLYARIAELSEGPLSDPTRAMDAVGGWLAEDPSSEEALGELQRLGEVVGRWSEVGARLAGIVATTEANDVKLRLITRLGELQADRLGDFEAAKESFRQALSIDPEAAYCLEVLERLHRSLGETEDLADVLKRRAELSFDAQIKQECYAEVGQLRAQLGQNQPAIDAWREVIALSEGDRQAHRSLAVLYEQGGDWEALVDVLGIASRYAESTEEDLALRSQAAHVLMQTIGDADRAIDAWESVLEVEPTAMEAFDALEGLHRGRQDWLAVQEVLSRRLEVLQDPGDRIAVLASMANLAESEREAPEEALDFYRQIVDIQPDQADALGHLERLMRAAERFHDLVELYEGMAERAAERGDVQAELRALARAADVWEGQLDSPDAAGEILEKILARDPNSVPALTRLAKIYEGASDWDKCGEVLQRALSLGPTGSDAADLYVRLGEVERNQSGDEEKAIQYFGQALQYDPSHREAIANVESAARERDDWYTVADMLNRRREASTTEKERLELAIELAEVYGGKLGQPQAVIPILEEAVQRAPEDPRVLGPLADLYFQAGRHQEAGPLFDSLATAAKKQRKMKDVARYRERQAGIALAAGNVDEAKSAYEEAFRIDPTNVVVMAGLGRLYLGASEHEKARRVFRSLVLQNIDPSAGITKAEVYMHLGEIHAALGESQKAKGMYQRGLELEPDNQALKAALAGLE